MLHSILHFNKRIFVQARPYWLSIVSIFLLSLLASPIALLKPLALKILIDSGFGDHPVSAFIRFFFPKNYHFSFEAIVALSVALVLIIAFLENIYIVIIWILNTYIGEKLVLNLRTVLFNHIQRLSLAYHDEKGISDSFYRLQWDTMAIRTYLLGNLFPLLSSVVSLLGMIIVMFTINWHFATIAVCLIPPLMILTKASTNRLKNDWERVKEDETIAMSVVQEALGSLRVVKAFGQEDSEEEKFVNKAGKAVAGQLKVAWISAIYYFIVGILFAVGTGLFIYFGAVYVKSDKMTLGQLTLVLAYLAQILSPLEKISKSLNDIQSSVASLNRVFFLLDKEKEVKETPHSHHLATVDGSFEFQNICFSYQKGRNTLQDISFKIKPGDRVGIMGSTGAGKSTLISLLMRFYDPTTGKILVDGIDIRNYRLADYRNLFAIVLQEPVLFSTTIAENIRYGRPGASEKDIIAAAKAANAHDFIIAGKDGYNTMVGERGMQLSGGERQRISLARAFIKNAPVLILDEPTSSLDVKTEAQIMEATERLMKGRTTFMITHRLDTLKPCNVILHLEKGRLVDIVLNDMAILQDKG